jgi:hypothetical protein
VLAGIYVHFAAGGAAANLVAMDTGAFSEFLTACGLGGDDAEHEALYAAVCSAAVDGTSPFVYPPADPTQPLMCRFAFLEALVWLAAERLPPPPPLVADADAKAHAASSDRSLAEDLAATLRRLVEHTIVPSLARHCAPPNVFRVQCLYTAQVDRALEQHLPLLQATFKCYTRGGERMFMPQWMQLLMHAGLLNVELLHVASLDSDARVPAQRCFALSVPMPVDEVLDRAAMCALRPVDFLEALVRLVASQRFPSRVQLRRHDVKREQPRGSIMEYQWLLAHPFIERDDDPPGMMPQRRDLSDLLHWEPRPLEQRLDQVLEYMVECLCAAHGVQYAHNGPTETQHSNSTQYLRMRLSSLARPLASPVRARSPVRDSSSAPPAAP